MKKLPIGLLCISSLLSATGPSFFSEYYASCPKNSESSEQPKEDTPTGSYDEDQARAFKLFHECWKDPKKKAGLADYIKTISNSNSNTSNK